MVAPQPIEPQKFEPPPLPPAPLEESEKISIESGTPTIERAPVITTEEYEARAARAAQDAARRVETQGQWIEDYATQAHTEVPPEEIIVLQEIKKKPKNLLQRFFDRIISFGATTRIKMEQKKAQKAYQEDPAHGAAWENETKNMPPLEETVESRLELSRPEKLKKPTEYAPTGEAARRKEIIDRAIAGNDRAQLEYWLSILSDEWEAGVKKISAQTPTPAEKELYKQAIAGKADLRGEPTQLDYTLMDLQRIKRALTESATRAVEVISAATDTPTREIPLAGRKTSPETPHVRPRIEKMSPEPLADDEIPTREFPKATTAPPTAPDRGFETDEVVAATSGPKTEVDLAPPTIETPEAPEFDEQKYQKDRASFVEEYANFEAYRQLLEKNPHDTHYQTLFNEEQATLDTLDFFGRYPNRIHAAENKKIADEVLARAEKILKTLKPYTDRRAARTEVDLKPPVMEVPLGEAKTLPATPAASAETTGPYKKLTEYLTPAGQDLGAVPQETQAEGKEREHRFALALAREQVEDQMQKIRDTLENESEALLTEGQKESLIKKLEALNQEHESLNRRIGNEPGDRAQPVDIAHKTETPTIKAPKIKIETPTIKVPLGEAPTMPAAAVPKSEAPTVQTAKAKGGKLKTEKATPKAKRKPTTAPETIEAGRVREFEKVRHDYVALKAKLEYLGRKIFRREATGRPTIKLLDEKLRTAAALDELFLNEPQWRAELTSKTDRDLEEDIMKESLRLSAEEPIELDEDIDQPNTG